MIPEGGRTGPWRWVLVVAAGVLLSLRFGFNFGIGNHNTYLLHALRRVHPELLSADWLASSTQDYHPVFTHLAALLLRLDESGWLFALLNVLCITMSAVVVYLLNREILAEEPALVAYLVTVGFMGVGSTYSVSGSYLFSTTFQPSTVAALGYLLALLWFVRGRHLASGLCLAVAGAFHANFAVLALPWFCLAQFGLGSRGWIRRVVLQLTPVGVTLALLSPLLLSQAGSPHAEAARTIFQQVLAPQHYVPRTYWTEFVVFFAWCGLGELAGGRFLFGQASRPLRALWLSSLLLIFAATLLTTVVFISKVSQLYVWRLAPYTVLISQIAFSVGVAHTLAGLDAPRRITRGGLLFLVGAALIWLTFRYHYGEFRALQYGLLIALAVVCLLATGFARAWRARSQVLRPAVLTAAWVVAALLPVWSLTSRSNLISGGPPAETELYAWAATTPDSSVFLIPPQLENFRFNARRAVVVDFKSTPVEPGQLLEWYRRLSVVCGTDSVRGPGDVATGYARLDSSRLTAIEKMAAFDFVVVGAAQSFTGAAGWRTTLETDSYRVYRRASGAP